MLHRRKINYPGLFPTHDIRVNKIALRECIAPLFKNTTDLNLSKINVIATPS